MGNVKNMEEVAVKDLRPYERNAKLHPQEQIEKIKKSIEEFGFLSPCLIDREGNIIAGHGRIEAAKELGLETVPCVYVEGLTDEQRRAYILADNRLTELGGWDMSLVEEELAELGLAGINADIIGFDDLVFDFQGLDSDIQIQPVSEAVQITIKIDNVEKWRKHEESIRQILDDIEGASISVGGAKDENNCSHAESV